MNEFYTRNVLEAALLAAGKPLTVAELGQLFDEGNRPKVDDIRATLDALAAEYTNRGLEVKETAAGFRIQVRREFASEISRLWPERPARYSRALLETLALIAYRQPITRAEIEAVRGVAVNPNIVKTVIERNWVRVVGHRDVPGRPELLGTTREFLDYFGLRSLDELPPLAELKAMGDYNLQLELPNAGAVGVDGEVAEGVHRDIETDGLGRRAHDVVGGLFARWLSLRMPDRVRQVITVCSPIHEPARNFWLPLQPVLGLWPGADLTKLANEIAQPLTVPGSFLFSRDDGLVNFAACRDTSAPAEDNIEFSGPHVLMARNPEVMVIVTQRLARAMTPRHGLTPAT